MKVLMINSVCGIGSTGRICTDIAETLEAQNHECKIAYGRGSVPEKFRKYAVRIGNNTGVNLHALQTRIFDNTGSGSKAATKRFIKWVKEYDPDVIHLHNIHGYYINIGVLFDYLKKAEKKIIWTLHDCWAFTGHCAHFELVGCNKWKDGTCGNCPQKKEYPASMVFDNSKNNFIKKKNLFTGVSDMTVVVPSEWLASIVRSSFLNEYNIKIIRNGIDTDLFKPTFGDFRKRHGLKDKKIILGVASVWSERKGFNDILKLSETLDDNCRTVLVGADKKLIKSLPDNILGITHRDNPTELAEIYTCADVLVNPTFEDTYPTVNLEAQACGTPVITYRTGGSPECVPEDHVTSENNAKSLKQTVDKILSSQKCNVMSERLTNKKDFCSAYIECYSATSE